MKEHKKILILVLGCDPKVDPFFTDQYLNVVRKTWASDLPDRVKVLYYYGSDHTELEDNDILALKCEDDFQNTYKKTYLAFNWIMNNMKGDFDYVFRTNTSTYVNVQNLMMFVDFLAKDQCWYGSDIYSLSEACAPYPLCPYCRGNGILLSRRQVESILQDGISILYLGQTDDIGLGNVMNGMWIKYHHNDDMKYHERLKGLPHSWYKCIDKSFDTGHKLSDYNTSDNYDISITTTIKKYRERVLENDHYFQFHEISKRLQENRDLHDAEERVLRMESYMNNPNIFLGSIIGYIDYNRWKSFDKNVLYLMEISNKATDDEQFERFREIQGRFGDFNIIRK